MSAASLYRAAMLAYPPSYRRAHGPELVDTADELAGGRWSVRQAWSLLVEGLRTRLRLATGGSPRQAWANGLALALMLSQLLRTGMAVNYRLSPTVGIFAPAPLAMAALAGGLVVMLLTVTTRWPAVGALAAMPVVWQIASRASDHELEYPHLVLQAAPPVAVACVVAAVGDGRRALSPRWTGIVLVLTVGLGWSTSPEFTLAVMLYAQLLALPLLGLAIVWLDPRPLAAASGLWLLWGLDGAWLLWLPSVAAACAAGASLGLLAAWWAGRRSLRTAT